MITVREAAEKVGRALVAVIPTRRLVAIVIALSPLWLVSADVAIVRARRSSLRR